jgi:hypothetical protein
LYQFINLRRNETVVLRFPHHGHTTRSSVQSIPDLQKDALAISSPLMIPKSHFFDALRNEKMLTFLIALVLSRQTVLEAIQFNGQFCDRTIKIEEVFALRMLPAEFEAGKTPRPQSPPQFPFLIRLFAAQTAGVADRIHGRSVNRNF